jgi:hypothetical protein
MCILSWSSFPRVGVWHIRLILVYVCTISAKIDHCKYLSFPFCNVVRFLLACGSCFLEHFFTWRFLQCKRFLHSYSLPAFQTSKNVSVFAPPPHMQRMQLSRTSLSLLLCPPSTHAENARTKTNVVLLLRRPSSDRKQPLLLHGCCECSPELLARRHPKKKDKKRSKYVALDFSAHFLFFIFYFVSSFLLI